MPAVLNGVVDSFVILPDPDYWLYFVPEFVDDGAAFLAIKAETR